MIQPCLLLFFWVSFVVWSGCRKPFVRLVKFRACLLCFRVLFWAFCFGGRSIPDALFFPFTYCIRATFLLLKESACIGITNFPLLVSCSCTRTMHAVATPVFTSLSLSFFLFPLYARRRGPSPNHGEFLPHGGSTNLLKRQRQSPFVQPLSRPPNPYPKYL